MKQTNLTLTLKMIIAALLLMVNQTVKAQSVQPSKGKSTINVSATLDLDLSSSNTNITAYPNNTIYPGNYEIHMRVTGFVHTGQYGKFYLYPQRRNITTSTSTPWSGFVPNGTTLPNQFPNTGPLATPSPTYSGTAKTLQHEGSIAPGSTYQYRVKVVFYATGGGSKTVYTPVRTATVLGQPEACFTMYNVNSSQSEPSYYGPQTVNTICQYAVTINGSCSKFENGYHVRIAEFDLDSWSFVEDYYSGWVGSGEAPAFISLNALAASNGKFFVPGKLYVVGFSIGPVWQSAPVQFFRVVPCRVGSDQELEEVDVKTLEDDSFSTKLKLYPNPSTDYVKVSVDGFDSNNKASIKIFNHYGTQVYQGEMKENDTEINTSKWKPGMYLFQIQVGDKVETTKIIKK